MKTKRIGILSYDSVADVGLVGPLQAFSSARSPKGMREQIACYEVTTIGLTAKPFTTEAGLTLPPQYTITNAPPLDTLIIPGGSALRTHAASGPVSQFVAERAATTRRIVSVCTGIYGVAPTGLLDHRRVTTHWRFVRDVARRFPALQVEENALFLQDGKFFTSAGGTAGIDLSLALIAQDFGNQVALDVARDLLVYLRRDGGQEQYAEPAPLELQANGAFGALARWIDEHLATDLRIENLAERVQLGKVHFIRQFKSTFGVTPALFIKNRRLNEARGRLLRGENTADVAKAVGFRSTLYFSQEFKWRFGTGPDEYQNRFRLAVTPARRREGDRKTPLTGGENARLTGRRWQLRRSRAVPAQAGNNRRGAVVLDAA